MGSNYYQNPSRAPALDQQINSASSRASALPSTIPNHPSQDLSSLPPPANTFPRKRNTPKRNRQIMTRMTDREYAQFSRRLERSGLPQGEFLRRIALTGEVTVVDQSELLAAVMDMLSDIRTNLGKQNGLLKMVIRPNEGQRQLAPEEWNSLIQTLRDIEQSMQTITALKDILEGS